jgi:tetratricopeptide (TPR) repeat protein
MKYEFASRRSDREGMVQFPRLMRPDAPEWHVDPEYSPSLGEALAAAYAYVPWLGTQADDFLSACMIIAPWLNAPIAAQQRVRIGFLFARAHQTDHEYRLAIRWVDEILTVALKARAHGEFLELLAFQGVLYRSENRFQAAADDLEATLDLLYYHAKDETSIDPALHLDFLSQLATYEFFLGHFREAMQFVRTAQRLMPRVSTMPLAAASVIWVQAHLDRIRGAPERALQAALQAAEVHEREASLTSQDRMETFVAEVALDLAERVPSGPAAMNRTPFLALARAHRLRAEQLARTANDLPGQTLAKLARVRESRLRGGNDARVALVESVMATAKRMQDIALLAQALTALGDELHAQRELEQAKQCWRQALTVLEGSEVLALRVLPQRALLLAREPHVEPS